MTHAPVRSRAGLARDDVFEPLRRPLTLMWPTGKVAVALSGGADSAMLAVTADDLARERGTELLLLHVDHGLLPQAQAWADQVQALAHHLGRPVDILRVNVGALSGRGMEAAARDARYAALLAACEQHGATSLLLAHHQDDQAETVLLRLLRGAGVTGLAAMSATSNRGAVQLLRPWLQTPRARILAAAQSYAQRTGWQPVTDPTNLDPRYTRAALRTRLTPVLNDRWPGWQAILGRHARQSEEAASILEEVAQGDLVAITTPFAGSATGESVGASSRTPYSGASTAHDPRASNVTASAVPNLPDMNAPSAAPSFSLAAWRGLSAPRQRNVLRYWLAQAGARMPTEARLLDLQRQLNQLHALGHDRHLVFDHGDHRIRCVRGQVKIEPR